MKILHTADIHLREYEDERWRALEKLIEIGRKERIGIFLVSGDLFDKDINAENFPQQHHPKVHPQLHFPQPFAASLHAPFPFHHWNYPIHSFPCWLSACFNLFCVLNTLLPAFKPVQGAKINVINYSG